MDAIALDCEFRADNNGKQVVKQIAVVNWDLEPIYEWREERDAITRPLETVTKEVRRLIHGRTVIGHELVNDLNAIGLEYRSVKKENTAVHPLFTRMDKYGSFLTKPLKEVTMEHLGEEIQGRIRHDAVEDAQAAMKLYKKYADIWHSGLRHHGPLYKSSRTEARKRSRVKRQKETRRKARLLAATGNTTAAGVPGLASTAATTAATH